MLIETKTEVQARRLELDDFSRTGRKSIEADLSKLDNLLDREDTEIMKVSLSIHNSEGEQEIINREIKKHSGKVKKLKGITTAYHTTEIKRKVVKLFYIEEKKLTIYRNFKEVIEGDYKLKVGNVEEQLEKAKQERIEKIENKIQELKEEREEIKGKKLENYL